MKFRNTSYFLNAIENVSRRAGYNSTLNPETVEMMFKGCIYEQAWKITDPSPWCSVICFWIFFLFVKKYFFAALYSR